MSHDDNSHHDYKYDRAVSDKTVQIEELLCDIMFGLCLVDQAMLIVKQLYSGTYTNYKCKIYIEECSYRHKYKIRLNAYMLRHP